MINRLTALWLGVLAAGMTLIVPAGAQTVTHLPASSMPGAPMPVHIGGRIEALEIEGVGTVYRRQWPGTYFETAFNGSEARFMLGPGNVALAVTVDNGEPVHLVRPAEGLYRVGDLAPGPHWLRVEVISESQDSVSAFAGFRAPAGTAPLQVPARARQIEFIGDSHTVGYGNTSETRECTGGEVWETTDTSLGLAGLVARAYDADYQVNAISGRGIVRNYNGGEGDTLPEAYPYVLFDHSAIYQPEGWHPQVVIIALGTNDFSTGLNPGEPWETREALQADYVGTYAAFLKMLRARYADTHFVIWATGLAEGEIAEQAQRAVDRVRSEGETEISFVKVTGLGMHGCHWHPDLADDAVIASALREIIDATPGIWDGR